MDPGTAWQAAVMTGQIGFIAHPAGRHHRGLQQGQHHMAAAEDQRTGAVEHIEFAHSLRGRHRGEDRQPRPAAPRTPPVQDGAGGAAQPAPARRCGRSAACASRSVMPIRSAQ